MAKSNGKSNNKSNGKSSSKSNGTVATKGKLSGGVVAKASKEISELNRANNPVVQALQAQVANGIVLYLNYKHYHWQVYGPLFRDMHLLFDEFANAVLVTVDEIAERIRMIGGDPVFDPTEMGRRADVKIADREQTMRQMLTEADGNAILVIKGMRDGAKLADENDDPGTTDVFARFVQVHEKHEWFFRDILEKGDRLID